MRDAAKARGDTHGHHTRPVRPRRHPGRARGDIAIRTFGSRADIVMVTAADDGSERRGLEFRTTSPTSWKSER